ncbi:MAG: pyridoxamine 5'-phosphate oxidase family protein [Pseudomonadota bacterium]
MSAVPIDIDEIGPEAEAFLYSFKTLHLATSTADGEAVATYAPYAMDEDGSFIIYVSELSAHTANLQRGAPICALFIEAEQDAEHLFARKRLTYHCNVEEVSRDQPKFDHVMSIMQERFGDFIDYMKKMKDFHAFKLHPTRANYVRGFAQAYEFPDAKFTNVRHINDKGHKGG